MYKVIDQSQGKTPAEKESVKILPDDREAACFLRGRHSNNNQEL
jgi:hypothetical protein